MGINEDDYLGDGVYASFQAGLLWLDLRAQDDSRIALEPQVWASLKRFVEEHGDEAYQ